MLDQMQQFYVAKYPDRLKTPADYRRVGELMHARYPCIKRYIVVSFFLLMYDDGNDYNTVTFLAT